MKQTLFLLVVPLLLFSCASTVLAQPQSAENTPLPDFMLESPESDQARHYLGITKSGGEPFSIHDIDADILLIELFSMYCPFCQEEAPAVNRLHQAMLDYSVGGMQVKLIGLGANNSAFEVDHFRTTYEVAFPLFPDKDMAMYKALDGKGTPGFVGCRKGKDGRFTIVFSQSGGFHNADDFLAELLQKAERE